MSWTSRGRIKPGPAEGESLAAIGPGFCGCPIRAAFYAESSADRTADLAKMSATRRWLRSNIRFSKMKTNLKFIAHSIHNQKFPGLAKLLSQLGYLTLESAQPEIETCSVSEERKCHCCLQIQPHLTRFYNYKHSLEELA